MKVYLLGQYRQSVVKLDPQQTLPQKHIVAILNNKFEVMLVSVYGEISYQVPWYQLREGASDEYLEMDFQKKNIHFMKLHLV